MDISKHRKKKKNMAFFLTPIKFIVLQLLAKSQLCLFAFITTVSVLSIKLETNIILHLKNIFYDFNHFRQILHSQTNVIMWKLA